MGERLYIKTSDLEVWDPEKESFSTIPGRDFSFMYSLRNLDLWETKHRKRFIDNSELTNEDISDLISIMCDQEDFRIEYLSTENIDAIIDYMKTPPSATIIPPAKPSKKRGFVRKKIFTSEIIYAHMAISGIPFEWEDRNLNKLIILINAIGSLQQEPEKMSKAEAMEEHRRIIMERRKQTKNVTKY